MTDEQRISDLRDMHYWVEEPDYSKGSAGDLVKVCYEDGSLWPCDAGALLEQLAASRAEAAALRRPGCERPATRWLTGMKIRSTGLARIHHNGLLHAL